MQIDIILATDDEVHAYQKEGSSLACIMSLNVSEHYSHIDQPGKQASRMRPAHPRMLRTSGWPAKDVDGKTFIDV